MTVNIFRFFWHSLLLTLSSQNHRPPNQTGRYWRPKRLSWSQPSFSFSRLAVTCHLKWIDNNTKGSNQGFTLKMDLGAKVGQCCYCCCCCVSVTIEYIIKGIFFAIPDCQNRKQFANMSYLLCFTKDKTST